MKIPLLATNDTHYTVPEQHEAHDLLLCIGTASNLDTPGRLRFETNEFYLKSPAEMRRLFHGELPDAMDNTLRVAEQVRPQARLRPAPPAALPGARWRDGTARGCARSASAGWSDRYGTLTDEVRHRLDYELGIIDRMGYSGLLPDRGRLHPLRPRAGDHDHLPGQRAGLDRDLLAAASRRSTRSPTASRSSASSTRTA